MVVERLPEGNHHKIRNTAIQHRIGSQDTAADRPFVAAPILIDNVGPPERYARNIIRWFVNPMKTIVISYKIYKYHKL